MSAKLLIFTSASGGGITDQAVLDGLARTFLRASALPTLRQRPASVSRWTTAARAYNWQPLNQQPRQIDTIILLTFASSRSMTGLVPSGGPLMG
jgi:hypothetical protein